MLKSIKIWTDGACSSNPGVGGWGAVIEIVDDAGKSTKKEISDFARETTNNRMELTAVIKALEYAKKIDKQAYGTTKMDIYTDSEYVRKGICEWLDNWQRNGWRTADGKNVKNREFWEELSKLLHNNQRFHWVKGHSTNRMNARADFLATEAIKSAAKNPNPFRYVNSTEKIRPARLPYKETTIEDDAKLAEAAMILHRKDPPGKIKIMPSKNIDSTNLHLIYTPGVAAVAEHIRDNPADLRKYTSVGNSVAIFSNGTATLGLGNTGHLAVKPVLEGKSNLLYDRAKINSHDIIIHETDVDKLAQIIVSIADNFAAIVLEDIKAPECFLLEEKLQKELNIPVIHDDQHGTAIAILAFLNNALYLNNLKMRDCQVVINGAGSAGLATANLLVEAGFDKDKMVLIDSKGVINRNRKDLADNKWKSEFMSSRNDINSLAEAIVGADVFIGLSVGNVLTADMVSLMRKHRPVILALANPVPEITPAEAKMDNPSAFIGTGSSRYPNQVNNMLALPSLLRLAIDLELKSFDKKIFINTAKAIADMALNNKYFDEDHLIPDLLDERLEKHVVNFVKKRMK